MIVLSIGKQINIFSWAHCALRKWEMDQSDGKKQENEDEKFNFDLNQSINHSLVPKNVSNIFQDFIIDEINLLQMYE